MMVVKKRHLYQYQNQWQWGESGTYSLSYIRFFMILLQTFRSAFQTRTVFPSKVLETVVSLIQSDSV